MRDPVISELAGALRACHSILNTAWPRPGVAAMARARSFIKTKLYGNLEAAAYEVAKSVGSAADHDLEAFAVALQRRVEALKQGHEQLSDEAIDSIFNLLYLATGVAFHRVSDLGLRSPSWAENLMEVEPVDALLRLCKWGKESEPSEQLLVELTAALERQP